MNLRYLLLISILVTACVFPGLALADESQEVKNYIAQCDKGEAIECNNLSAMYGKGEGVTQDSVQAIKLYRKACDEGNATGAGVR